MRYFEDISKSDITPKSGRIYRNNEWYHLKACLNTYQMSTNVMGFQHSRKMTNIFHWHSNFGDKSRPQSLKG
jgi:hypothetical protein